jgi:hypothetical protein
MPSASSRWRGPRATATKTRQAKRGGGAITPRRPPLGQQHTRAAPLLAASQKPNRQRIAKPAPNRRRAAYPEHHEALGPDDVEARHRSLGDARYYRRKRASCGRRDELLVVVHRGAPRASAEALASALGLRLTDLLAQRLRMHPQIVRDERDRPLALQRQANRTLHQLIRLLLRPGHDRAGSPLPRTESSLQSLRETRPGSIGRLWRPACGRRQAGTGCD